MTREWLDGDPPSRRRIAMLRDWLDTELAEPAKAERWRPEIPTGGRYLQDVPARWRG